VDRLGRRSAVARTVTVAVKPGRKPLVLLLKLRSGRYLQPAIATVSR